MGVELDFIGRSSTYGCQVIRLPRFAHETICFCSICYFPWLDQARPLVIVKPLDGLAVIRSVIIN